MKDKDQNTYTCYLGLQLRALILLLNALRNKFIDGSLSGGLAGGHGRLVGGAFPQVFEFRYQLIDSCLAGPGEPMNIIS